MLLFAALQENKSRNVCAVKGCTDRSSKKQHRFPNPKLPENQDLFNKWITYVDNPKLKTLAMERIYSNYSVCDAHFIQEFKVPGTHRGLRKDAVPTVNVPGYTGNPRHVITADDEAKQREVVDGCPLSHLCRICVEPLKNKTLVHLDDNLMMDGSPTMSVKETLRHALPDLDVEFYSQPVFCENCINLLYLSMKLKRTWTQGEKKLRLQIGDKRQNKSGDVNLKQTSVEHNTNKVPIQTVEKPEISKHPIAKNENITVNEGLEPIGLKKKRERIIAFSCKICGVPFPEFAEFKAHMDKELQKKIAKRPIKCELCNAEITGKMKFLKHKRWHKLSEGKNFGCDQCVETFATLQGLKKHSAAHRLLKSNAANEIGHEKRKKSQISLVQVSFLPALS